MAHPVDVYVGSQIRRLRLAAGLSQAELARAIGVAFQQFQRYEHASNRVSASRLHTICRALGTDIASLFPPLCVEGEATIYLEPRDPHRLEGLIEELSSDDRQVVMNVVRALVRKNRETAAEAEMDGAPPVGAERLTPGAAAV